MDYIVPDANGRVSLAHHLAGARAPLDINDSLKWAIQFCYGMEHALRHGIECHRDIKPANILIARNGTLKISDFGLALAAQAALSRERGSVAPERGDGSFGLSLTEVDGNRICGTPGYIAPEILLGREADVRSDVYSFGLVLWQMATGSPVPPFHVPCEKAGGIEGYLRRVFEKQTKGVLPRTGGPVQPAIERCLSPEPSQRYATFEELRRDLDVVFRGRAGRRVELPKTRALSPHSWSEKGVSLDELGRHDEAITCYDKALEMDRRNADTWSNKGTALGALRRYKEAIDCFDEALSIDRKSATALGNKGRTLNLLGRHEEALACFAHALEIEPHNAVIWCNNAWALVSLARPEEALVCFEKAVRIDPGYANAWAGRGHVLCDLGRLKEGNACLEKAEEIDPQCADDLKRMTAARGYHKMALGSFKPDAAAWSGRADAFAKADRHEEALICLAKALDIDPQFAGAWYNRGSVLSSLGRFQEALTCYARVLEVDPWLFDAWEGKGLALGQLGRFQEAATCLTEALRLAPGSAACWSNKGTALSALGQHGEAVLCYTRALEIDPHRAVVWDNKGKSLFRMGRCEEAVACFTNALEIDPHNATVWNNRGMALAAVNLVSEAISCFDKALQIAPGFAAARENKQKALGIS